MSWCPSCSNSLWQGWRCGLVHCPGGNATDPIWRVLASSDRISSWTPLKPQYSNPNPLANQLWCIDFLTLPTPLMDLNVDLNQKLLVLAGIILVSKIIQIVSHAHPKCAQMNFRQMVTHIKNLYLEKRKVIYDVSYRKRTLILTKITSLSWLLLYTDRRKDNNTYKNIYISFVYDKRYRIVDEGWESQELLRFTPDWDTIYSESFTSSLCLHDANTGAT